eukprot:gnl/Dysnectes_brevis/7186_a11808_338.p1 GENE.gnl/Dysnectes_brevis/7186_a11808_338~~gnl/Dysnectes_brevis/7186_a11808_338.p1  ORF type:complete len:225 (-),score=64.02 gnl/Dysnectes_brevis/7186_a11808_338:16-690(-)
MRLIEYRFVIPLLPRDFLKGFRFSVCHASILDTTSSDYIDWISLEDYTDPEGREGIKTRKILHFDQKVPAIMRIILSKKAMFVSEEAWNCFPESYSEYHSEFAGKRFALSLRSMIVPGVLADDNPFKLNQEDLDKRTVIVKDIIANRGTFELPAPLSPTTTIPPGRLEPLQADWAQQDPVPSSCTIHKLVRVRARAFGFGSRIERSVVSEMEVFLHHYLTKTYC